MVNIVEVYPGGNTCGMQCPECNMTGDKNATNSMGIQVLQTLEKLQDVLVAHNTPRAFEYTFPITGKIVEPIPALRTENLQRVSFCFGEIEKKHLEDIEITTQQSIGILKKLTAHMNPNEVKEFYTKIGFTINGVTPTSQEMLFLFSYFEKYKKFTEENNYTGGEIGLEHNMTSVPNIKNNLENFSQEKKYFDDYLKGLYNMEKDRNGQYKVSSDEEFYRYSKHALYTYDTHIQLDWRKLGFTKRVVTRLKSFDIEDYKKNAENIVNHKAGHSLSLYEHGVMINHQPLSINSPFLRVTHQKIQAFLDAMKTSKDENVTIPTNASTPFVNFSALVKENLETYKKYGEFSPEHMKLVNAKNI